MALQLYNTLSGKVRGIQTSRGQPRPHVCLRAHRLRLRPHRQLPHLHRGRCAAPLPAAKRLQPQARHEHHRRRRQDHSQRHAEGCADRRLHRQVHPGFPGRHADAQSAIAGRAGAGNRAHSGDGALYRRLWSPRATPTAPTRARTTSASPAFRRTASSARRTSRA